MTNAHSWNVEYNMAYDAMREWANGKHIQTLHDRMAGLKLTHNETGGHIGAMVALSTILAERAVS